MNFDGPNWLTRMAPMRSDADSSSVSGAPSFCASSGFLRRQPTEARMGLARPQRAGETENGTKRLATSAENVSYLAAFLFSLVQTSRKD